jgi:putative ABC transport system substrate-binding protein
MWRIGLAALAMLALWLGPPTTYAQSTPAKITMLLTGPPEPTSPEYVAFSKQLGELGWLEGPMLAIDRRRADAPEQFRVLAADAVRGNPTVIVTAGPDATRAVRQATSTIPIVMIASSDPRAMGVASFAHPGGNLTGLTIGQPEVTSEKRLQLIKEAVPSVVRVAVLWDVKRSVDSAGVLEMMAAAASKLGLRLQHLDVIGAGGFATAFAAAKRDNAQAMLLVESPRAVANRAAIAELGIKYRLPIISQFSRVVEAGGLMSYGPDLSDLFRRAAVYVDKILKGAQPGDLPVEQPMKFELVINLKTAKAIGLTIPQSLLVRADEIIQ